MAPLPSVINHLDYFSQRVGELGKNEFYPVMVLKRKVDNPDMEIPVELLLRENVATLEEFQALRSRVIKLCLDNNARCYMKVRRRNWNAVLAEMAQLAETMRKTRAFDEAPDVYNRALTVTHDKCFSVTVTGHGAQILQTVKHKLRVACCQERDVEIATLEIPEGYQVICETELTPEVEKSLAGISQARVDVDGVALVFAPVSDGEGGEWRARPKSVSSQVSSSEKFASKPQRVGA